MGKFVGSQCAAYKVNQRIAQPMLSHRVIDWGAIFFAYLFAAFLLCVLPPSYIRRHQFAIDAIINSICAPEPVCDHSFADVSAGRDLANRLVSCTEGCQTSYILN